MAPQPPAAPRFANVEIIRRCEEVLTTIEEVMGGVLVDDLAIYVVTTWTRVLQGMSHKSIPSLAIIDIMITLRLHDNSDAS